MIIDADRVRATDKPRLGILIDLADLERLMKRYAEEELTDGDDGVMLLRYLYLSHFLLWLTNKHKEQANGKTKAKSIGSNDVQL